MSKLLDQIKEYLRGIPQRPDTTMYHINRADAFPFITMNREGYTFEMKLYENANYELLNVMVLVDLDEWDLLEKRTISTIQEFIAMYREADNGVLVQKIRDFERTRPVSDAMKVLRRAKVTLQGWKKSLARYDEDYEKYQKLYNEKMEHYRILEVTYPENKAQYPRELDELAPPNSYLANVFDPDYKHEMDITNAQAMEYLHLMNKARREKEIIERHIPSLTQKVHDAEANLHSAQLALGDTMLAFTMSAHERLGSQSLAHGINPDVMRIISKYVNYNH